MTEIIGDVPEDVVRLPVDTTKWTAEDCQKAIDIIQQQKAELQAFRDGRGDVVEAFWRSVFVAAVPHLHGRGVAEYADAAVAAYNSRYV